MKVRLAAGALLCSLPLLVSAATDATEGNWLVRLRALHMSVDNHNSTTAVVPALGEVNVEDKWFPEIDFTYFLREHWAFELILTYPQEHDVTFAGVGIGTVTHLPPTLLLQYHFRPDGTVRPYVGAGVNYTLFSSDLNAAPAVGEDAPLEVDDSSWGLAGQAGVDIRLSPRWFANIDAKYVQIEASNIRVSGGGLAGTKVTDLDVNPWLLSVGVGYRFQGSGAK